MVCFILSIPRWLLPAVQQYWRLCRVLCSSAAAVEARWPVDAKPAAAPAPAAAAAAAAENGGGGGEAAGDDDGIMMMGSDDEAEADPPAPLPAGDGGAEGV